MSPAPVHVNGFAQKALVVLMTVICGVLATFFVWLATATIDISARTVSIEKDVKSLLETRTNNAAETTARTARRVEQLEQAADNPPGGAKVEP